jgi:ATP-dependent Clp protease ATP-binding subunit ClpA
MDAGNMLKPMLARGELHCIGATTLDEYRQYIEKDKALERRFQPVLVEEPNVEDTISILRGLKERYEVYHGVRIHDNALVAAATLSNRYISDRFLPDKAIDLVDEACATIRTEIDSMPEEADNVRRHIIQLEIEEMALKKETDTLSKERLEKLRNELGFNGVVVTDDLAMGAIAKQYGFEEALKMAIQAGCDLLCISNNGSSYDPNMVPSAVEAILRFVKDGTLSADAIHTSAQRIRALKATINKELD